VFGTLFNNITIRKTDSNGDVLSSIPVPISYGPAEKFLSRLDVVGNKDDNDKTNVALKLPRMSFVISNIERNASESTIKYNKYSTNGTTSDQRKMVREPVKYKLNYELSILSKHQDDAFQILEQILPFFEPTMNVTITDIEELGIKSDIPITLNSVSPDTEFEGDAMSRNVVRINLDFTVDIKVFGPVSETGVIKTAIVNYEVDKQGEVEIKYTVSPNPITAEREDQFTYSENYDFFLE
jgi:hypothetical protein